MMLSLFSLLPLLALATTVYGYADPFSCSGTCTNTHDPSLIRKSDGTYYRFSTGGKIAVHTAPSINGPWTYKGAALPNGSKINLTGNQDLWAPDVTLAGDGTYYLYYSVSSFGSQSSAIGIATSSDLLTWTDHGSTGVTSSAGKAYNAIDPNLYWDGSKWLLTFGSFWHDIYQVPFATPPLTVASEASSANVAYKPDGSHAQEGAFLAKWGNYHYLFFSVGKCCGYDSSRPAAGQEYKIQVCRSASATGGFVDKNGVSCTSGGGTTVLESHGWVYGPGGQGVMQDPGLGSVLYYHYVDTRVGYADGQKRFGVNKIDWSSGWPVV